VALAEQSCERVVCELAPGDGLFFHCNLLHCSGANVVADDPRWVMAISVPRSLARLLACVSSI
jgi:ectoine hydroxylase-related dioxygenase (phytanoyl-CoA dioxygenase family)